jgi:hypothetical protein
MKSHGMSLHNRVVLQHKEQPPVEDSPALLRSSGWLHSSMAATKDDFLVLLKLDEVYRPDTEGVVDESLALDWAGAVFTWKLIGPILVKAREVFGSERLWTGFEALVKAQAEL